MTALERRRAFRVGVQDPSFKNPATRLAYATYDRNKATLMEAVDNAVDATFLVAPPHLPGQKRLPKMNKDRKMQRVHYLIKGCCGGGGSVEFTEEIARECVRVIEVCMSIMDGSGGDKKNEVYKKAINSTIYRMGDKMRLTPVEAFLKWKMLH